MRVEASEVMAAVRRLIAEAAALLEASRLDAALARTTTAYELATSIGADAAVGEVLASLGILHARNGDDAAAEPRLREALDVQWRTGASSHVLTTSLLELAALLTRRGDVLEAAAVRRDAVDVVRSSSGEAALDLAALKSQVSAACFAAGEHAEAEALLEEVLAARRDLLGEDAPEVAQSENNLAELHLARGALSAAEVVARRAYGKRLAALGEDHPEVANSLTTLAGIARARGDHVATATILEHLLLLHERNDRAISQTANNLGDALYRAGEFHRAQPFYERARAELRARRGVDDPDLAAVHHNLGNLFTAIGNPTAAIESHRLALVACRCSLGVAHGRTRAVSFDLADAYRNANAAPQADELLDDLARSVEIELGTADARFAQTLDRIGIHYADRRSWPQAVAYLRRAIETWRAIRGDAHPDVAVSMTSLANILESAGLAVEAEAVTRDAVLRLRTGSGPSHPSLVEGVERLARLLLARDDVEGAIEAYAEVLAWCRERPDVFAGRTGSALVGLASAHLVAGTTTTARRLLDEAVGWADASGDVEAVVATRQRLAEALLRDGNLAAAERVAREAVASTVAGRITDAARASDVYRTLAAIRDRAGDAVEAESLYLLALERASGHPAAEAWVHLDLGCFHFYRGNLVQAEQRMRLAVDAWRGQAGNDDPKTARFLENLAVVRAVVGDYREAESLAAEAARLQEPLDNAVHARTLYALGTIRVTAGRLGEAEHVLRRAAGIQSAKLGDGHPETVRTFLAIADVYARIGARDTARAFLERGVVGTARSGWLGLDRASALVNLARLDELEGRGPEAEARLREALEILGAAEQSDSPLAASAMMKLARARAAQAGHAEAVALARRAMVADHHAITAAAALGSEHARHALVATMRYGLDTLVSLALRYHGHEPAWVPAAFSAVLNRKGIELEISIASREAIRDCEPGSLARLFEELVAHRRAVARLLIVGPRPHEDVTAFEARVSGLEQRRDELEARIGRGLPAGALPSRVRMFEHHELMRALPTGAALVEIVRFSIVERWLDRVEVAMAGGTPGAARPARYLAFVVRADRDDIAMIDLGDADAIEQDVRAFRDAVGAPRRARDIVASEGDVRPLSSEALAKRVLAPMRDAVRGARRLVIAPDGELSSVPWEVLSLDGTRSLVDDHAVSYVATGRDLITATAAGQRSSGPPVVVAAPDFDLGLDSPPRGSRAPSAAARFEPLDGARAEGVAIATLLGVEAVVGAHALESYVMAVRSPSILHIATHGFSLPEAPTDVPDNVFEAIYLLDVPGEGRRVLDMVRGPRDAYGLRGSMELTARIARLAEPLLRSGLALAGANLIFEHVAIGDDADDGIVTAEEVIGIDLSGTDLVVLSACETGRGETRVGEGILGLRRAFTLAGARCVVSSMWRIADRETTEFMRLFYERFVAGHAVADALRSAQLEMKARHPDPWYWGAFVAYAR
jgi:CHAT domain-containing protein